MGRATDVFDVFDTTVAVEAFGFLSAVQALGLIQVGALQFLGALDVMLEVIDVAVIVIAKGVDVLGGLYFAVAEFTQLRGYREVCWRASRTASLW